MNIEPKKTACTIVVSLSLAGVPLHAAYVVPLDEHLHLHAQAGAAMAHMPPPVVAGATLSAQAFMPRWR